MSMRVFTTTASARRAASRRPYQPTYIATPDVDFDSTDDIATLLDRLAYRAWLESPNAPGKE